MTEWIAVWIDTLNFTNLTDNPAIASLIVTNAEERTVVIVAAYRTIRRTDSVVQWSAEAGLGVTSVTFLTISILCTSFHTLLELKAYFTIGTSICRTWVTLIPVNRLIAVRYTNTLLRPTVESLCTLTVFRAGRGTMSIGRHTDALSWALCVGIVAVDRRTRLLVSNTEVPAAAIRALLRLFCWTLKALRVTSTLTAIGIDVTRLT
jgi:hypothetical protein